MNDAQKAAIFQINSSHHFHGSACLCGFVSPISRQRTEHLSYLVIEAIEKNARMTAAEHCDCPVEGPDDDVETIIEWPGHVVGTTYTKPGSPE